MGSSIEAAITIATVIFLLSFFIILPGDLFLEAYDSTKAAVNDMVHDSSEFTTEDFCTFMIGFSESFKIIIGGN